MILCPVNIYWDITYGMSFHTLWAPPPSVPPLPNAFVPSIEIPAPQMWTVGYLMGKNKFTTTMLSAAGPTCQGGHDLGPLIPDVTIPPANVYLPPIAWPFSKREIVFQAATVQFQGTPAGCAAAPFFPMLTCGDPVSLPTVFPIPLNYLHRVFVGLSFADIISGVMKVAISVVIDAIFHKIGGGTFTPGQEVAETAAQRFAREAAEEAGEAAVRRLIAKRVGMEFLGKVVPTSPGAAAKAVVSALAGYGESAINEALNPTDNRPSTKIGVGGGIVPQLELGIGGGPDQGADDAPLESGELSRHEVGGERVSTKSDVPGYGDPLGVFGGGD